MQRLNYDDDVKECVIKLADGNPGALAAMLKDNPEYKQHKGHTNAGHN